MAKLKFGEKAHFDGGKTLFLKLDKDGQKIHIRFLDSPVYTAKHFTKNDDGSFTVSACSRIMEKEECEMCETFFAGKKELRAMIKEVGGTKSFTEEQKVRAKELEAEFRKFGATLRFHYPIIDRGDKRAKLFSAAPSIRGFLDQETKDGVNVLDYDYKITRTGELNNYYPVTRMDSKMSLPLDKEEQEEAKIAKEWDIEDMVEISKPSTQELEPGKVEEPTGEEDVTSKEVPF